MALKQEIKVSEARILVYLNQVPNTRKSVDLLSAKLDIDYAYTIRILKRMILKGWVFKHKYRKNMFYDLSPTAPVDKAIAALSSDETQHIIDSAKQETLNGGTDDKIK